MSLDRVHLKAFENIVGHLEPGLDLNRQRRRAVEEFKRLGDDKEIRQLLQARGEPRMYYGKIEDLALSTDPFPHTSALDGGSAGCISFPSGLHAEYTQAALASTPTDLDLHRYRTVVCAAYSRDGLIASRGWEEVDDGYGRSRLIRLHPGSVKNHIDAVIHYVALYSAEAGHLNWQLDTVRSFLFVDGPLYPKSIMYWRLVGEEPHLFENPEVTDILDIYETNYRALLDRGVPPVGFVKSTHGRQIVKALGDVPWTNDSQFLKQVLEPGREDVITYTSWFAQVAQYYRNKLGGTHPGRLDDPGLDDLTPCFFYVYLPVKKQLYRAECPYGIVKDDETRGQVTLKVVHEVAKACSIPLPLQKVDQIARISIDDRRAVREMFGAAPDLSYDDERWGDMEWI